MASDFNAPASSAFNAGRESPLGVRIRALDSCVSELSELSFNCGSPDYPKAAGQDLDPCLFFSRTFHFLTVFPGDYVIRLTNFDFDPYIYFLTGGILPAYRPVAEVALTFNAPVFAYGSGGGISAFVGTNSGGPGTFDLEIIAPIHPAFVTVDPTVVATVNAANGTSFTGILAYTPCERSYREVDLGTGFALVETNFDIASGTDPWQLLLFNPIEQLLAVVSGSSLDPLNPYGGGGLIT